MKSNPQHFTLQRKKSCGIKVGPDLFRLVSVLGGGSSLVGGRVQFDSLLFRADQTKHLYFGGSFWLIHRDGGSFDTQFCMAFILSNSYWARL